MIDQLKYDEFFAKFSSRLDSFLDSLFEGEKVQIQEPIIRQKEVANSEVGYKGWPSKYIK